MPKFTSNHIELYFRHHNMNFMPQVCPYIAWSGPGQCPRSWVGEPDYNPHTLCQDHVQTIYDLAQFSQASHWCFQHYCFSHKTFPYKLLYKISLLTDLLTFVQICLYLFEKVFVPICLYYFEKFFFRKE